MTTTLHADTNQEEALHREVQALVRTDPRLRKLSTTDPEGAYAAGVDLVFAQRRDTSPPHLKAHLLLLRRMPADDITDNAVRIDRPGAAQSSPAPSEPLDERVARARQIVISIDPALRLSDEELDGAARRLLEDDPFLRDRSERGITDAYDQAVDLLIKAGARGAR